MIRNVYNMKLDELLKDASVVIKAPGEHHHARQGWLQLDCPFCGKNSSKFHMGLNTNGGYFNCYRCGKLDRTDVVAALLDVTPAKASRLLKDVHFTFARSRDSYAVSKGTLRLPSGIVPLMKQHREYLRKRGFSPSEIVEQWKVQGIGISARLGWRLFIPIIYRGKTVSWTTRSIGNHSLRYISANRNQEETNHKTLLYGEDFCTTSICICEGPISAWAIGPGAVATCGLGFTQPQLVRMSRYPRRYICFDAERQAQRRAHKLADSLSAFPGSTANIVLETGKDPAECDPSEKKEIQMIIAS